MTRDSAPAAPEPARIADEKVLVFDFGSQYAQLIARRVREQSVYCEIVRHDVTAARVKELAPKGIILSGGPASVYEPGAPHCDPAIFQLGIPVLGICYGMQLVCEALGGRGRECPGPRVWPGPRADSFARRSVRRRGRRIGSLDEPRRSGVAGRRRLHPAGPHRHLPDRRREASAAADLRAAVSSRSDAHAARHEDPGELPDGRLRLHRHLAAGGFCRRNGGPRAQASGRPPGDLRAFRAASIRRSWPRSCIAAIGPQLSCILVDNGLLRKDEAESVIREFTTHFRTDLHVVQAEDQFLSALAGITDPQEKRKIIGHEFIECFKRRGGSNRRGATFSPRARSIPT